MSENQVVEIRNQIGELKATYEYIRPSRPTLRPLVFIHNETEQILMFRVCKNGKPIAFPLLKPRAYKFIPIQSYMNVQQEDTITVIEHLEDYEVDGTEFD